MVIVIMKQTSQYTWKIVSKKTGHIIMADIHVNDKTKAEDYIKAYISSFHGWGYEMDAL